MVSLCACKNWNANLTIVSLSYVPNDVLVLKADVNRVAVMFRLNNTGLTQLAAPNPQYPDDAIIRPATNSPAQASQSDGASITVFSPELIVVGKLARNSWFGNISGQGPSGTVYVTVIEYFDPFEAK